MPLWGWGMLRSTGPLPELFARAKARKQLALRCLVFRAEAGESVLLTLGLAEIFIIPDDDLLREDGCELALQHLCASQSPELGDSLGALRSCWRRERQSSTHPSREGHGPALMSCRTHQAWIWSPPCLTI